MISTLLQDLTTLISQLDIHQIETAMDIIRQTQGKLVIVGNGGSNAIASHMAEDYSNNYKLSLCFSDTSLMSCFANDYGWEEAFLRWLKLVSDPEKDTVILISSSGASKNIIHCAHWARDNHLPLITLSGFKPDNPLRQTGQVNFWVNSLSYKDVEITHLVILHTMLDALMKES
jgi:D-sedoheptulose 7-phosphate isomerase